MTIITRRAAIAGIAAGAISVSAPPARAQAPRFDGQVLRVATFGGGWDRAVHKYAGVKLEELGAKVEYVTAPPRDNLAKLIAAKNSSFKLQPDHKLVFRAEWDEEEARLSGVRTLVKELAALAVPAPVANSGKAQVKRG